MSTQTAIPEGQTQIAGVVAAVRDAIRVHADWGETAELVAAALRRNSPYPAGVHGVRLGIQRGTLRR
jgi:hypothetical protein